MHEGHLQEYLQVSAIYSVDVHTMYHPGGGFEAVHVVGVRDLGSTQWLTHPRPVRWPSTCSD
jgi:hypothetical protein